eukprot:m.1539773 g.1539773  ORF g.1539773 m.1539773 type:complete len:153 (+) comp25246_c0_seq26:4393-4851(+)
MLGISCATTSQKRLCLKSQLFLELCFCTLLLHLLLPLCVLALPLLLLQYVLLLILYQCILSRNLMLAVDWVLVSRRGGGGRQMSRKECFRIKIAEHSICGRSESNDLRWAKQIINAPKHMCVRISLCHHIRVLPVSCWNDAFPENDRGSALL